LAPDYVTRETLNQKALTLPKRRFRAGAGAIQPPKPEFSHREIVSYYAPSYFRTSSAAPHEFRALLNELEKTSLAVAATDFGQLILLFTKANQGKYNSKMRGAALAGADRAIIVDFGQSAGAEAFRVAQPGKEVREPLTGSR
jgi:hypothetical protein